MKSIDQEISDIRTRLTELRGTTSANTERLAHRLTKVEDYLSYLSENMAIETDTRSTKLVEKSPPSMPGEVDTLDGIKAYVENLSKDYFKKIQDLNALIISLQEDVKALSPPVSEKDQKRGQTISSRFGGSRKRVQTTRESGEARALLDKVGEAGLPRRNRPFRALGVFLTSFGGILLVWVCWLVFYDLSIWGKDLAMIFWGSRTGEAISLGIGMKVIHYTVIGFMLLCLGASLFLQTQLKAFVHRRRSTVHNLHVR